jgi:hypothetical protein
MLTEACNPFLDTRLHSRSTVGLSDLVDSGQLDDGDFGEGMKMVLDAVHPDVRCPEKGDWILPTLLMPWNGNDALAKQNRAGIASPRTPTSSSQKNKNLWGRQ